MSSSCLSGGGGTYRLELEIVKSQSTSTRNSHTSSQSSTLTESNNSPLAISTRKPRTPRKRPNQNYYEAAALLSTVYPNIFSTKPGKFTKPQGSLILDKPAELLLPFRVFDNSGLPLHQPVRQKPTFSNKFKDTNFSGSSDKSCQNSMELCEGYEPQIDAESILDEEIEEGIDSIMGNLSVCNETAYGGSSNPSWYGNPIGFNFGGIGLGRRSGVRAFRNADEANWWNFPIVDMLQISPRLNNKTPNSTSRAAKLSSTNSDTKLKSKPNPKSNSADKKQKKAVERPEFKNLELAKGEDNPAPAPTSGLLLKLNYDEVLNAWSDRGPPFSDDVLGSEGNDVSLCLSAVAGK